MKEALHRSQVGWLYESRARSRQGNEGQGAGGEAELPALAPGANEVWRVGLEDVGWMTGSCGCPAYRCSHQLTDITGIHHQWMEITCMVPLFGEPHFRQTEIPFLWFKT